MACRSGDLPATGAKRTPTCHSNDQWNANRCLFCIPSNCGSCRWQRNVFVRRKRLRYSSMDAVRRVVRDAIWARQTLLLAEGSRCSPAQRGTRDLQILRERDAPERFEPDRRYFAQRWSTRSLLKHVDAVGKSGRLQSVK